MKRIIVIAFHNMKRLLFALAIVSLICIAFGADAASADNAGTPEPRNDISAQSDGGENSGNDRLGAQFESGGLYYEVAEYEGVQGLHACVIAPPDDKKADYLKGVKTVEVPPFVTDPVTGDTYSVYETNGAFNDLPELEEVRMPYVTDVYDFYNLPRLHSIELSRYTNELGGFRNLPSLKTLNIPESLRDLSPGCFQNVGIENFYLPVRIHAIPTHSLWMKSTGEIWLPGLQSTDRYSLYLNLDKFVLPPWFAYSDYHSIVGRIDEIRFLDDGVDRECQLDLHSFVCETKRIYCEKRVPPVITDHDGFDTAIPEEVIFLGPEKVRDITLYVPEDCVETYRQAPIWNRMKIVAHNFDSDIESIEKDDLRENRGILYDLSGRVVTTLSPRPGIYVRDGRKILVR